MEKKKYIGRWSANNGSTYNYGYESNNKREIAKSMRAICAGNVFPGNSGYWQVSINGADPDDDAIVLEGICRR